VKVLIVDDEAPARAKLRRLAAAENDVEIVGEAASGDEAVEAIRQHAPDVVFLDVQMPGRDGFGVVAALPAARIPRIVFVTAHLEHAVKAFEVRAIDYLLKPVPPARFRAMLQRVREDIATAASTAGVREQLRLLADTMSTRREFLERILVRTETRSVFVPVDRVDWIDADRNNVRLHVGATVYTDRGSIGDIAAQLDPARFLRINRSQVVRLDAVRELHSWSHGDYRVIMNDGTSLSWSRRYRAETREDFRPRRK
jgi:two-component system LytT family response regulator